MRATCNVLRDSYDDASLAACIRKRTAEGASALAASTPPFIRELRASVRASPGGNPGRKAPCRTAGDVAAYVENPGNWMPLSVLPALCDAAQHLDPRGRRFSAWVVDASGDVERRCPDGDDGSDAEDLASEARQAIDALDATVPLVFQEASRNHLVPVPLRDAGLRDGYDGVCDVVQAALHDVYPDMPWHELDVIAADPVLMRAAAVRVPSCISTPAAKVFGVMLKWLVDQIRAMYGPATAAFRCDDFSIDSVGELWNKVSCAGERGAAPGMDGGWTVDLWKTLVSARCGSEPRQALATFVRICHEPAPDFSPAQEDTLRRLCTAFLMAPVIVFGGLVDVRDRGGCLVPGAKMATRVANRVSAFFAGRVLLQSASRWPLRCAVLFVA
eukprot:g4973.t1